MKLQIGDTIKRLRRERDLTQEELAEVLNVSYQSVSRWENNMCYPDTELLPVIAGFFDITVDRLMGVDKSVEARRVQAYLEAFQAAISVGDVETCIRVARDGVREYPNNYALLNKLMYALFVAGDDDGSLPEWKENAEKYDAEITSLGERIIRHCPDQAIRLEAAARLAFNHCEMGRPALGRQIYETLPEMEACRELHIMPALAEGEKLPHARALVEKGLSVLYTGLYMLTRERLLPDGETEQALRKAEALQDLVYDGRYPAGSWETADHHCQLAKVLTRLGRFDEAVGELARAAESARAFDEGPESVTASCLLLGDCAWRRGDRETDDPRPLGEVLRDKWLASPAFDPLRDREDFSQLIRVLSE